MLGVRFRRSRRNSPLSIQSGYLRGYGVKGIGDLHSPLAKLASIREAWSERFALLESKQQESMEDLRILRENTTEERTKNEQLKKEILENGEAVKKVTATLKAKNTSLSALKASLDEQREALATAQKQKAEEESLIASLKKETSERNDQIAALRSEKQQVDLQLKEALETKHLVKDDIEGLVLVGRRQRRLYIGAALLSFAAAAFLGYFLVSTAKDFGRSVQALTTAEFLPLIGSRFPISLALLGSLAAFLALAKFFLSAIVGIDKQVRKIGILSLIARDSSEAASDQTRMSANPGTDPEESTGSTTSTGAVKRDEYDPEVKWRRALQARMAFLKEYLPAVLDPEYSRAVQTSKKAPKSPPEKRELPK